MSVLLPTYVPCRLNLLKFLGRSKDGWLCSKFRSLDTILEDTNKGAETRHLNIAQKFNCGFGLKEVNVAVMFVHYLYC